MTLPLPINTSFHGFYCSLVIISCCIYFAFILLQSNLCYCFFENDKNNILCKTKKKSTQNKQIKVN